MGYFFKNNADYMVSIRYRMSCLVVVEAIVIQLPVGLDGSIAMVLAVAIAAIGVALFLASLEMTRRRLIKLPSMQ